MLLFAFFKPSLVLIGFASFVILVFEAVSYIGVKRKIMPELIVNIREYDIGLLKDILKAGGWNALNNVNGILTMGLDLLFANIFLGPTAAGVLALARTIPNYFETLMELVKNSFIPALTKGYAKNEDSLTENLKLSFVGLSLLASVILGGIISFGEVFYQLWIPTEDSHMLQLLTIVILFVEFTYAGVRTIPMIFQITNRLKRQALSSFGGASLSVVIVIVLLKTTSLGLFIIAGVTSVITTLIRMFYLYPLAAKYIKQKWYIFYPEVLKALLSIGLAAAVGLGANMLLRVHSWGGFLAGIMITALAATTINLFIFTNKDQRRTLLGKLKQLVGHSAG